jgi:flagella basal body P-ring formation protein FlgA
MTLLPSSAHPLTIERAGRLSPMILIRVAVAVIISFVLIATAFAAGGPVLKSDVVVNAETLTLADLIEGVPPAAATKPLFRAPALGESGTVQVARILDAARALGVVAVDTGARTQVVVTRAARRVTAAEIEAAVKRTLAAQHGTDAQGLSITFDGPVPALTVAPDFQGPLSVTDLTYDRRSRRVAAVVAAAAGTSKGARVSGAALTQVEVAVLTRPLARGEAAQASDFALEKRVRETLPADVQVDAHDLAGRVARRALHAGAVVRSGDLARPEIVSRGDIVTIVYEAPGIMLTLRGRASDSGAEGDTIAVVNPQSKKTLHGQVIAPGKVSVSAPLIGRMAAHLTTAQP